MDTIAYYLFDTCRAGIILALLLEVVALLWWAFTRSRRSAAARLLGPALVGLTFLLDWAVETNREQAERITRQIVQAAEDENADAMIGLLSPQIVQAAGEDYPLVCSRIRQFFAKPLIQWNRVTELIVESADDSRSRVKLSVLTQIDPKCPYSDYTPLAKTQWLFEFTRDDKQEYRLARFTMLGFNGGEPVNILTLRNY